MKTTFIGHASILTEVDGATIISDPWWRGPCFGAQWWLYPTPYCQAFDPQNIDYIYISHGHNDHFHPGTLKTFSRSARILVSESINLADAIREMGFKVSVIKNDEVYTLTERATCRIIKTHGHDTLMAISDGVETCINLNDALHSAPADVQQHFIAKLKSLYPRIDYVFCGYGVASHFPNCYIIPGKDAETTAAKRQQHFNRQWVSIIHGLNPRFGFPFAADVIFLENSLFWANEPTHNSERPTEIFQQAYPNSSTRVLDIAPGFVVENGEALIKVLRQKLCAGVLKNTQTEAIKRANCYAHVDETAITRVKNLLQKNIDLCQRYFSAFDQDYRFLIKCHNASHAIDITKNGADITLGTIAEDKLIKHDYDVIYTTRLSYLKLSLSTKYGHEILFVGSGGIFEYKDKRDVGRRLNKELMVMMERQEECPSSRDNQPPEIVLIAKRIIKKLLGIKDQDLYDLQQWTIFRQ